MKKTLFLIMILGLLGCNNIIEKETNDNFNRIDSSNNDNELSVSLPVKIQFIKIKGMNYMISSGGNGITGTSNTNLTLDSLQCEYYKNILRSK